MSRVFRALCLPVIHFVEVLVTVFWTSNSQNENRISINIWSTKEVTSSDVHGFFPTVNEEIQGKKKMKTSKNLLLIFKQM